MSPSLLDERKLPFGFRALTTNLKCELLIVSRHRTITNKKPWSPTRN